MENHFIISVKIVQGISLNPRWKSNMQVIQTDKGLYIDNIEGKQFGFFKDSAPGYSWSTVVGQQVSDIEIFYDHGYQWINKAS